MEKLVDFIFNYKSTISFVPIMTVEIFHWSRDQLFFVEDDITYE